MKLYRVQIRDSWWNVINRCSQVWSGALWVRGGMPFYSLIKCEMVDNPMISMK